MNFHPDQQLFQNAGAGDLTTDPWITSSTLIQRRVTKVRNILINFFAQIENQLNFSNMSTAPFTTNSKP